MSTTAANMSTTATPAAPPPTTPSITLYLDLLSPFAYLAHHLLTTSPLFTTAISNNLLTHHLIPIHLSTLLRHSKNQPPLATPLKRSYTGHDLVRQTKRFNIPFSGAVEGFPINTFDVMAVCVAVQAMGGEGAGGVVEADFGRLVSGMYEALWVRKRDLSKSEIWQAELRSLFPAPGVADEIIARAGTEENKARLVANTTGLFDKGGFGLPWIEGKWISAT